MDYIEFEKKLITIQINKKEFAEFVELSYQTIMNWQRTNKVPPWVRSWLDNYIKAKVSDDIIKVVKPFIKI